MKISKQISYALLAVSALLPTGALAQSRVPESIADLDQKIAVVLPTEEEQRFLQIPWHLNLTEARAESVRTGKPMFVWQMNGHPLCHT